MPLELRIVSEHADIVGNDAVRKFNESGGTIGRSLRNDWVISDPEQFLSGRHATIDFRGGIYYLADTSSNGVFLNDEREPVGRGNPCRLFDGDHLRMGDIEMLVSIDTGESLVMPMDAKPSVAPDNIEQFVEEDEQPVGEILLDEEALTGDREFKSALCGDYAETVEKVAPHPGNVEPANDDRIEAVDAPLNITADDLFDSFLDGLGISRAELDPTVNRPEMMLSAGQVLREFVKGTSELLAGRSNLKNAFRLDQTTMLPGQNNPLKFNSDTNDLLKLLLAGRGTEYLGAPDSVREVCRDLMNHQDAFLDAMSSAFLSFATRFDPNELRKDFDHATGKSLFGFMSRMKYWQLYCDMYPIITEKGGGRFPQMFSEEFINEYERLIAEYQRDDHQATGIDRSQNAEDQAIDQGLCATRQHEAPQFSSTLASDDGFIVDVLSESAANEVNQGFFEEIESTQVEIMPIDQIKA